MDSPPHIEHQPTVTIGLPVYNGEDYVAGAIRSILNQTFSDFELVISDNASTDCTQAICEEFAASDPRIVFIRNERNQGAARNFNLTVEMARGRYFKWAAHDDTLDETFLDRSVAILEEQSDAILAYSKVVLIDQNGHATGKFESRLPNLRSPQPEQRFRDLVFGRQLCYEVFGLMRTDVLRCTPLIGTYVTADRNLLAELSLLGPFAEVPGYLLRMRQHKTRSVSRPRHERLAWFDPTKPQDAVFFPYWREYGEYFKSVRRVDMPFRSRARCCMHVTQRMTQNWKLLRGDLRIAAGRLASRTLGLERTHRKQPSVQNDK